MDCPLKRGSADRLIAYAAARLDAEESARLDAHLYNCPHCADFVNAQRALWLSLDEWEAPVVSTDFNRRLYAAIDREAPGGLAGWLRAIEARLVPLNWRAALPVAAGCATLVFAVWIGSVGNSPASAPPAEPRVRMEKVDLDQVERALDDVEMLQTLNSAAPASASTASM